MAEPFTCDTNFKRLYHNLFKLATFSPNTMVCFQCCSQAHSKCCRHMSIWNMHRGRVCLRYEVNCPLASSHPHHATERGLRREVPISWKLHVERRRLRAGCTHQDRKSCIHFSTTSSYMVTNYSQLEYKVMSIHPRLFAHVKHGRIRQWLRTG